VELKLLHSKPTISEYTILMIALLFQLSAFSLTSISIKSDVFDLNSVSLAAGISVVYVKNIWIN